MARQILIVSIKGIGDQFLKRPFFFAARALFPNDELSVVTNPDQAFIVGDIRLDNVFTFDRTANLFTTDPFFQRRHVSAHHGLEIGSLYRLLAEAHRAYVFGCNGAAMALCRTILELVLTRHYGIEGQDLSEPTGNSGVCARRSELVPIICRHECIVVRASET